MFLREYLDNRLFEVKGDNLNDLTSIDEGILRKLKGAVLRNSKFFKNIISDSSEWESAKPLKSFKPLNKTFDNGLRVARGSVGRFENVILVFEKIPRVMKKIYFEEGDLVQYKELDSMGGDTDTVVLIRFPDII